MGGDGLIKKVGSHFRFQQVLLIPGIILLAANLRPAITGVGPLVDTISRATGLSQALAGLLTTLPLVAFGLVSPVSPVLVRRLGIERTLFLGLAILSLGILLRSLGPISSLLIGMFLVGSGAAIGNVLLPGLVKRDFPFKIGLMTGLYSTVMNIFAALSSGMSVPLSHISGVGWRGSLASWILLTGCAMVLWLPQMKNHHSLSSNAHISLRHSRVAWQITLFMGLQSLLFYVNVAWLPNLLHDRGMTLAGAGWMVSLMQFVSLPASFLMPIIAGRRKNQQSLVLLVGLLFGIGYLGLLFAGVNTSWIWIVLIGMAGGASISLALAFFSLRSHTHGEAAQLSGMAQSIGYLLAALGPISIGLIHHATKNWTIPLVVLLAIVVVMGLFGWGAGQDVYVNDGSQASLTA